MVLGWSLEVFGWSLIVFDGLWMVFGWSLIVFGWSLDGLCMVFAWFLPCFWGMVCKTPRQIASELAPQNSLPEVAGARRLVDGLVLRAKEEEKAAGPPGWVSLQGRFF